MSRPNPLFPGFQAAIADLTCRLESLIVDYVPDPQLSCQQEWDGELGIPSAPDPLGAHAPP